MFLPASKKYDSLSLISPPYACSYFMLSSAQSLQIPRYPLKLLNNSLLCTTSNSRCFEQFLFPFGTQENENLKYFLEAFHNFGFQKESYVHVHTLYRVTTDTWNLFVSPADKGYLRTSPGGLLPYVKSTLKPPLSICQVFGGCFDAGDFRANEQIALASMHTMWVREHNRIAHVLQHLNRHWDGDQIYQEARKIVGAQIQHITYTEYLPKVLGAGAMPPYDGYKDVDPTISNVFAAAAFRFGHSLVRPSFALLDANYDPVAPEVPLMNAFFNNKFVQKHGIENILLGLLANVSLSVDRVIAAGLTKHLFQQPESDHGFDLAALNIQRGRDHGLPGYGAWRRECNLPHAEIFEEARDQIKSRRLRRLLK